MNELYLLAQNVQSIVVNFSTFQAKATMKQDIQESVQVSAVASSKKVPDDLAFTEKPEVAKVVTTPQESVTVTEVGTGVVAQEEYKKVKGKKKVTIQESVQVQEFEREEEVYEAQTITSVQDMVVSEVGAAQRHEQVTWCMSATLDIVHRESG